MDEGIKFHKQMAMTGKYPDSNSFGVQSQKSEEGEEHTPVSSKRTQKIHHPRHKGANNG